MPILKIDSKLNVTKEECIEAIKNSFKNNDSKEIQDSDEFYVIGDARKPEIYINPLTSKTTYIFIDLKNSEKLQTVSKFSGTSDFFKDPEFKKIDCDLSEFTNTSTPIKGM